MSFETWASFVAAAVVVHAIPGPVNLVVASYSLAHGLRAALLLAVGMALADTVLMTLALLGLGAVLAMSPVLFAVLTWAGAAYMAWLAWGLWRSDGALAAEPVLGRRGALRAIRRGWLIVILSPMVANFFMAFLPRFIDPAQGFWRQLVVLEATFVLLGLANAALWGLAAARASRLLATPQAVRLLSRAGASGLIGTAAWTAVGI